MLFTLEYHDSVKLPAQRSIPVLLGLLFLLVSLSTAQHESASASAASSSSGHSASASAPSAMSPAHTGYAPSSASGFSSSTNHSRSSNGPTGSGPIGNHGHPHHHHSSSSGDAYYPYWYLIPVPYAVDAKPSENDADDDDDDYQGGPTIFDRRGSGASSYVPPTYEGPAHARPREDGSAEPTHSKPSPEPPQPPTTLVFKDGHQLEIGNYAIVSQTLYDLTPGHSRKIAVPDLDLPATEKQNDDRGVPFQLPTSTAN
jgi:hypothetical protein